MNSFFIKCCYIHICIFYTYSQGIHLHNTSETEALGTLWYFFMQWDVILWISMRTTDSPFCIFSSLLPSKHLNGACFKMSVYQSTKFFTTKLTANMTSNLALPLFLCTNQEIDRRQRKKMMGCLFALLFSKSAVLGNL